MRKKCGEARRAHRPGEAERHAQPPILLDAERVGAQHRCARTPEQTPPRRHLRLEVLQAHREKSPAAARAAAASVRQRTFGILKMMEIYLEHT